MTIENFVLCHRNSVPSRDELQGAIRKSGFDLEVVGRFSPLSEDAEFVECLFEGHYESGFDVWSEPLSRDDFNLTDEQWAIVGDRDTLLVTSTYSNAQEIMSAVIATAAIVQFADALWLDDFYDGDLIEADQVADWVKSKMPGIRDQFKGPSRIRQARMGR